MLSALTQHRLAKHGRDQTIQAHWKQYRDASSDASVSSTGTSPPCCICGRRGCQIASLEPIVKKPEVVCKYCGRTFGDERALRQHLNFCKQVVESSDVL